MGVTRTRYCTNSMGCKIMNITLLKRICLQTVCLNCNLKDAAEITHNLRCVILRSLQELNRHLINEEAQYLIIGKQ
jgi:hypothetical protein